MSVEEIIKLIQAFSDNKLTGFELKEGDMKLTLKCEKDQPQIVTVSAPGADLGTQSQIFAPAVAAGMGLGTAVQAAPAQEVKADIGSDKVVTSPLVGTFYSSSSPDSEALAKVGDTVKKGQVLGIIEAMKLMNEIESEYDGVIEAILVNNEEVVEYGQPLFRIK